MKKIMSPELYGLYSVGKPINGLEETPEELLSRGYGATPFNAIGDNYFREQYYPAPYTGSVPFQNIYRRQYEFTDDEPSGGITELDLSIPEDNDIDSIYNDKSFDVTPEQTGIRKLLQYLPFGDKSLFRRGFEGISNLIPRNDPRTRSMQNFYGSRFGLTPTGSVASGIMAGYNPVSGFGENKKFGLQRAYQKRIDRIQKTLDQGRGSEQLEERLAKLKELKRQEQTAMEKPTIDRARDRNRGVYEKAKRENRLGPGGGFSTSGREGAFSSKSGRGRQDY